VTEFIQKTAHSRTVMKQFVAANSVQTTTNFSYKIYQITKCWSMVIILNCPSSQWKFPSF